LSDPEESTNLAGAEEFQAVKEELSGKIDVWMKRIGDRGIEGEIRSARVLRSPEAQRLAGADEAVERTSDPVW